MTRRFNIAHAARQNGKRKFPIRLRPARPALKDKRALRAIFNHMVASVYEHKTALVEAAQSARPASKVTDSEIIIMADSRDDLDRLLSLIVTQSQNVMTRLQIELRGWAGNVERGHREKFAASLLSATKVDLSTALTAHDVDKTVEHYLTWSTSLIRDVGDEARRKIAHATLAAVRENQPPAELARTIREFEDMSYRRAKNIAADQTTKLLSALDRARQEEVGITAFTWVHSGSPHPREEHLARDGEVFPWDTSDIDAGDFPGEPPFCGCSAQATIVDEAGNEIDGTVDPADIPDDVEID